MCERDADGRTHRRGQHDRTADKPEAANPVLGYRDQGKSDGVESVTGGHRLDRKGYFVHTTVTHQSREHEQACPGGDLRPGRKRDSVATRTKRFAMGQ